MVSLRAAPRPHPPLIRHVAGWWHHFRIRLSPRCPIGTNLGHLVDEAGALAAKLDGFGAETDEEFTNLAGGLSELTSQLSRMREQAGTLDDILQDRDEDKALANAYALCKDSIDLVHASLGISHSMQRQLNEVDESLQKACGSREDFEKNFLLLRTLSMGFRIEAVRVDKEFQGVFANVAGAIREIDEKIAASTRHAFDNIQSLVSSAAAERVAITQGERALYEQATHSIRLVQEDIDAMRRALAPCVDASLRIGELITSTQPHTVEVLKSLQFQDIVRQKLEHVATGFCDIVEHSGDRVFLHRAAQLQRNQLGGAREEFERAGQAVMAGLNSLLDVGCKIDEQLKSMETAAVEALGRTRMAELFQHEILELARIADSSEAANRRITNLVERIEDVVEVFSREIGSHEREVKLVALNAQIAAARVGSAGALEKLSEETSMVAGRNASTTRKLSSLLGSALDRLRRIKSEADEFLSTITGEKHALEEGATRVGAKLVRHRTTIQEHTSAVRTEFSVVHAGIRSLLESIQFPATLAATFGPAATLCQNLAQCTGAALEDEVLSHEGAERFHAHLARYTMQEERDAHAAVLGGAATAARTVTRPDDPPDDVELFDTAPVSSMAAKPPATVATEMDDGIELFSGPERPADTTAAAPDNDGRKHAPGDNGRTSPPTPAASPSATPAPASQDFGDGIELF